VSRFWGQRRKSLMPVMATVGSIMAYREVVANPQQMRRRSRKMAIAAVIPIVVATAFRRYFARGQKGSPGSPAVVASSAAPVRPVWRPAQLLPVVRPLALALMAEALIRDRDEVPPWRALVLAGLPVALMSAERALRLND
jgi:hypothetical protein